MIGLDPTHLTLSGVTLGQGDSTRYASREATASGDDQSMRGDWLDFRLQRTPLLIDGDSVIQNGSTVDAFPRMEHQEEV